MITLEIPTSKKELLWQLYCFNQDWIKNPTWRCLLRGKTFDEKHKWRTPYKPITLWQALNPLRKYSS